MPKKLSINILLINTEVARILGMYIHTDCTQDSTERDHRYD